MLVWLLWQHQTVYEFATAHALICIYILKEEFCLIFVKAFRSSMEYQQQYFDRDDYMTTQHFFVNFIAFFSANTLNPWLEFLCAKMFHQIFPWLFCCVFFWWNWTVVPVYGPHACYTHSWFTCSTFSTKAYSTGITILSRSNDNYCSLHRPLLPITITTFGHYLVSNHK